MRAKPIEKLKNLNIEGNRCRGFQDFWIGGGPKLNMAKPFQNINKQN